MLENGRGLVFGNGIDISQPGGGVRRGPLTNRGALPPPEDAVEKVSKTEPSWGKPVLPVRVENWGLAGEVRIASVRPYNTINRVGEATVGAPVYPASAPQERLVPEEPKRIIPERVSGRHTEMRRGQVLMVPFEGLAT